MKFEEKLYKLRKEKKISQNELAEILEVSRQAISKWEVGTSKPDMNHLILISNYFEVSLDYLLNEKIVDKKTITDTKKFSPERKIIHIRILVYIILCFTFLIIGNLMKSVGSTWIWFGWVISIDIFLVFTKRVIHFTNKIYERRRKRER